jgi:hypothetical protein
MTKSELKAELLAEFEKVFPAIDKTQRDAAIKGFIASSIDRTAEATAQVGEIEEKDWDVVDLKEAHEANGFNAAINQSRVAIKKFLEN